MANHQIPVVPTQQVVDFNQSATAFTDHDRDSTFRERDEILHMDSMTCGEYTAKMWRLLQSSLQREKRMLKEDFFK